MKKEIIKKISKNSKLHNAQKAKNDEFYTQLTDINKELGNYKKYFKNKVVFCNCDDPEESNFWKYFELNFEFLGLKKLISTHFEKEKPSYRLEMMNDINKDGKINGLDIIKTPLKQNGDFRSPECIEILKEADIVVTNPPFSLFREYVEQLVENKKKFIIIGNQNAITYKEIFKLIKDNKIWLGTNSNIVMKFKVPTNYTSNDGYVSVPAIAWFTNLIHNKRNEKLILYKKYNKNEYPKYDNYNAINVDKVKNIPICYNNVMGVPISFLGKHNPEQFEIVRFRKGNDEKDLIINGKCPYFRILIKKI